MLFLSKRSNINQHSSDKNTCLSFLGLILASGIIAGLVGLIYGKTKHICFILSIYFFRADKRYSPMDDY